MIPRDLLCEFLSGGGKSAENDDLTEFIKQRTFISDDDKLRKLYYEENNWQYFKKGLGNNFKNMQSSLRIKGPL